jgi:hypothetical protein
MYLTPPGEERFEAAALVVVATDWQRVREQSLAAPIRRSGDSGPVLDAWTIAGDTVAPAFARSLYAAMFGPRRDRKVPVMHSTQAAESFRYFAEEAVPAAVAQGIDEIHEDWDGSPLFLLASPEEPDLALFVLESDPGIDQLTEIVEIVRELEHPPVAVALVLSGPLFTPAGHVPNEGLLSILSVDDGARQAARCRRLIAGDDGRTVVTDLPPDVVAQIQPGVTRWFMTELLAICGSLRGGEEADQAPWEALLQQARERGTTPDSTSEAGAA